MGTFLPQPRVLHGPQLQVTRLDNVLGRGWSLLGVGLTDADWNTAAHAGLPAGKRVSVVLDDRYPRDRPGRTAVADADGRLQALFGGLTGHFLLVRPDRLIAAVFPADQSERVSHSLRRFAPAPEPDVSLAASDGPAEISHEVVRPRPAPTAHPVTKSVSKTQGGPR